MTMEKKTVYIYTCDQCGDVGNSAETMIGIDRIGMMDSRGYYENDSIIDLLHFCDGRCLEAWIKGRFK